MNDQQRHQQLVKELESLYRDNGGLNPRTVLEWARSNPSSELYRRIEWNDTVAAEEYRLQQVRSIIVSVRVRHSDGKTRPIYVSPVETRGWDGYQTLVSVLSDDERRARFLAQALGELEAMKKRYADLIEFCALIDKLTANLRAQQAAPSTPPSSPAP